MVIPQSAVIPLPGPAYAVTNSEKGRDGHEKRESADISAAAAGGGGCGGPGAGGGHLLGGELSRRDACLRRAAAAADLQRGAGAEDVLRQLRRRLG